jgi:hypothetical protein
MSEEFIDIYGNYAIKLLRLQGEMIQTFDRYRRGNKQTVEVRHVHIHSGGQGVVGIINARGLETGVVRNNARPHATSSRSRGISRSSDRAVFAPLLPSSDSRWIDQLVHLAACHLLSLGSCFGLALAQGWPSESSLQ